MESNRLLTDGIFADKLEKLIAAIRSNGGGASAIIEVAELPTEEIDTASFYLYNKELYYYVDGAWKKLGEGDNVVSLSGESGTLTKEQYDKCESGNAIIQWTAPNGYKWHYLPWDFSNSDLKFFNVLIGTSDCVLYTISITKTSRAWARGTASFSVITSAQVDTKIQDAIAGIKIPDGVTEERVGELIDEAISGIQSGGSGGGIEIIELSGNSGVLTDEQYNKCISGTVIIRWSNSNGNFYFKPWQFISPKYYFSRIYIGEQECEIQTIEIDQINHSWAKKSTTYNGGGGGSGGVTNVFTDVEVLPSPDDYYASKSLYRVTQNDVYTLCGGERNRLGDLTIDIIYVDSLPSSGVPVQGVAGFILYFQATDDKVYGYLPPEMTGQSVGMWLEFSQLLAFAFESSDLFGGYIYSASSATNSSQLYIVNDFINQKSSIHYYGNGEFKKLKDDEGGLLTLSVYISDITHELVVEAFNAFMAGRPVMIREGGYRTRGSLVIQAERLLLNNTEIYLLSYLHIDASSFDTPRITTIMSEDGKIKRGDLTDEEPLTNPRVMFENIPDSGYNYYSWDASSIDVNGYGFVTNSYAGNIAYVEMLVDAKVKGMKNYKINGRFISSLDYVYVKAGDTIEVASALGSITIYGLDDGETVP